MKAMILAAGKGERMLPLTRSTPKPLLIAGDRPLIVHHIERLASAGVTDIIINTAHLGKQIHAALGDRWLGNVAIRYSHEAKTGLETAGGIARALPLLGEEPFILVNADVWTDYPFTKLSPDLKGVAHLVMVDNPAHNPSGDFALKNGKIHNDGESRLTFSGISVIRPRLIRNAEPGPHKLAPFLRKAASEGLVSGERHMGIWDDIGTQERLEALNRCLKNN
ncbi:MAG: nucleotidyltransferase family protein [Halothiobacillaceae bacterium]|nr:MAG: nucleotidyltransferase family protein [Halothiobacillaceae bacterium]